MSACAPIAVALQTRLEGLEAELAKAGIRPSLGFRVGGHGALLLNGVAKSDRPPPRLAGARVVVFDRAWRVSVEQWLTDERLPLEQLACVRLTGDDESEAECLEDVASRYLAARVVRATEGAAAVAGAVASLAEERIRRADACVVLVDDDAQRFQGHGVWGRLTSMLRARAGGRTVEVVGCLLDGASLASFAAELEGRILRVATDTGTPVMVVTDNNFAPSHGPGAQAGVAFASRFGETLARAVVARHSGASVFIATGLEVSSVPGARTVAIPRTVDDESMKLAFRHVLDALRVREGGEARPTSTTGTQSDESRVASSRPAFLEQVRWDQLDGKVEVKLALLIAARAWAQQHGASTNVSLVAQWLGTKRSVVDNFIYQHRRKLTDAMHSCVVDRHLNELVTEAGLDTNLVDAAKVDLKR